MPKRFTLVQAQSLIPQLDRLLRDAVQAKSEYQAAEHVIQEFTERVMMMGGIAVNRDKAVESRSRRDAAAAQLRASIEQVQELGCVIKDLDIGLIDFPTLFRGVEVYLCWKLGESGIEFWHSVDEGFSGRKPIDQDFLDHHQGERSQ
jgi:hypothetical protein